MSTSLNDKIHINIELGTLATLLAGLYCLYSSVDPIAIPESLYIELAEKLIPFLDDWNYERMSFEDWVKYNLMIYPVNVFSQEELKDFSENSIFFYRENGNVLLLVTAEIP